MGYRQKGRWGGGGTWQSKLKSTRIIEQMHLMIINKHVTKFSMQVPPLSEVVERDRFLNSSFVSSRQSALTSITRSKVRD